MHTLLWLMALLAARHPMTENDDRQWRTTDRGEGVISASIAVMVIAFLGALMWIGFQQMWERTETRTTEQVDQIGG